MITGIEKKIKEKYKSSKNRLVLLDYDGTLVNYTKIPDTAMLPGHISEMIVKLDDNPGTKIFIITGRTHMDIDKVIDNLPVSVIAEHGAFLKESGVWKSQINEIYDWKKNIIPILNRITATCPGSFVEEKDYSLTWHYRNADDNPGYAHSRELIALLEKVIHTYNLKILDGNKVVEILSKDTGKGRAVKKLVEQNIFDFILSIGDDATDEEMFEFFLHQSNAFTVKVGEGATYAKYKLDNIDDVASLLNQLSA
jgi:trehalose 6-phosphate synthase/phosphatase